MSADERHSAVGSPGFLTPEEVAVSTKLTYRTVLAHIRRGWLRASAFGVRGRPPYRIHPDDLEEWRLWMAERAVAPTGVSSEEVDYSLAAAPTRRSRTGRRVVELVRP
jgi:excisionase family DNA binding protein